MARRDRLGGVPHRLTLVFLALSVSVPLMTGCQPEQTAETPGSSAESTALPPASPRGRDSTVSPEAPADDAAALWEHIQAEDYSEKWAPGPGYDNRQVSTGPHGEQVQIFVNTAVQNRLEAKDAGGLPVGAVIVKDIYSGETLQAIAVMEKVGPGSWYWAEYQTDGTVIIEGRDVRACAECHREGKDFVRAFEVP